MGSGVENAIRVIWGLLVRLVVVVGSVYVLYRVRTILISLLIAILLTYALLPFVDWMCRRRLFKLHPKTQRLIATIIVFVVFLGIVGGTIRIIITPFNDELTRFADSFGDYVSRIKTLAGKAGHWYARAVPADIKNLIKNLDYSGLSKTATAKFQDLLQSTTSWVGLR